MEEEEEEEEEHPFPSRHQHSWTVMTLRPHQLQSKPPPIIRQLYPPTKATTTPPLQPPHPTAPITNTVATYAVWHKMKMASKAHRERPTTIHPSHHSPPFPSPATLQIQHPNHRPSQQPHHCIHTTRLFNRLHL